MLHVASSRVGHSSEEEAGEGGISRRRGRPNGDDDDRCDDRTARARRHAVVENPLVQTGEPVVAYADRPIVLGGDDGRVVTECAAAHNATAAAVGLTASLTARG